jgi:hypothetical protein
MVSWDLDRVPLLVMSAVAAFLMVVALLWTWEQMRTGFVD